MYMVHLQLGCFVEQDLWSLMISRLDINTTQLLDFITDGDRHAPAAIFGAGSTINPVLGFPMQLGSDRFIPGVASQQPTGGAGHDIGALAWVTAENPSDIYGVESVKIPDSADINPTGRVIALGRAATATTDVTFNGRKQQANPLMLESLCLITVTEQGTLTFDARELDADVSVIQVNQVDQIDSGDVGVQGFGNIDPFFSYGNVVIDNTDSLTVTCSRNTTCAITGGITGQLA